MGYDVPEFDFVYRGDRWSSDDLARAQAVTDKLEDGFEAALAEIPLQRTTVRVGDAQDNGNPLANQLQPRRRGH